jgi:proteasome lid subunit RPN8/RPN11
MTSRLVLSAADRAKIVGHLEAGYPEEACGILLGRTQEEGAVVFEVILVSNAREESRHNRYVIPPAEVLAAQKRARLLGGDIVGYFHSHPDHPAEPSEFDREHAWPGSSYLIVAVRQGRAEAVRSWRLTDDRERFVEEVLLEPES